MRTSFFLRLVFICSTAILSLAKPNFSIAADSLYLSLRFEENLDAISPAYVYVGGKLAGTVPGIVEIPTDSKETSVEIGSPQLETPLYSFVFGEKQILAGFTDVVMSNISFQDNKEGNFWSSLSVGQNTLEEISLKKTDVGNFDILLPSKAFFSFRSLSDSWGMKPYDKDWFGKIPTENYAMAAIPHVTYDAQAGGVTQLVPNGLKYWNGSYREMTQTSFGLNLPTEQWSVKSIPLGAKILTDQGQLGVTNTDIEINKTSGSFLVLKLTGYADCPKEKCREVKNNGKNELVCRLKKSR